MMRRALIILVTPMVFLACGKNEEEVAALVQQALDGQKAVFDAEMKKMQAASDETVSNKDGRISGLETEVTRLGGDLTQVKSELGSQTTQLASTKTQLAATSAELEMLRKQREKAEKDAAANRAMVEKLKSMVDAGKLQVVNRKGRMTLNLPDNILFPSGSKQLKKEGKEALISVAEVLKGVEDRDFVIAGHTDNVPVKKGGTFKSNWELSTARAVEVVNLMIENGVSAARLAAAGFGEFDPIGNNEEKDGRVKNRRLEIILMPKIEDLGAMTGS